MKLTTKLTAVAALTSAGILAGCSTASAPAPSPARSSVRPSERAQPTPAAPAVLTRPQARREYVRLVTPYNAAVSKDDNDYSDGASWPVLKSDLRAEISALATWQDGMNAVVWPRPIRGYIAAEEAADVPAEHGCLTAELRAGSVGAAVQKFNTDPSCNYDPNASNVTAIRTWLGLPPPPS